MIESNFYLMAVFIFMGRGKDLGPVSWGNVHRYRGKFTVGYGASLLPIFIPRRKGRYGNSLRPSFRPTFLSGAYLQKYMRYQLQTSQVDRSH